MRKLIVLPFLAYTFCAWATEDTAIVSSYGSKFDGRKTASGQLYSDKKHTAAHRTLPFGTCVLLRNNHTGRFTHVTINDRGPHIKGRLFDISGAAAKDLGIYGLGKVHYEVEPTAECQK